MKTAEQKIDTIFSDWVKEEQTLDQLERRVVLAMKEQDRDTRHACADAVTRLSVEVANANSYRGKVNQAADFACQQLNRAAGICINTRAI